MGRALPRASAIPGLAFIPAANARTPAFDGLASEGLTSMSRFTGGGVPLMLGDLTPVTRPSAINAPWVRGYKMADNQSPRPQDRIFAAFNFFDDLRQPGGSDLRQVKVYREFFGLEKTFFDQSASIGLRMPLNTITALSDVPGRGGTSTAVGDLTVFAKGILLEDTSSGSLFSGGLAVTPPTGPSSFAGARFAKGIPTTSLQPFVGYIVNFDDWFIQGFSGPNLPTDRRVTTMFYNDIGAGYYLYRAADPDAFFAAVVPTFEVHVNTPLNHRTTPRMTGTPDAVDLTFGTSVLMGRRTSLSAGLIDPVTGPRPFRLEAVLQLNYFFGKRRAPGTPPPLL
jgi:hypothetical protein